MKLQFLGTGNAFTEDGSNWQSNALLEKNGHRILIDAGGDIRHAMRDAGVKLMDVGGVYVSHLHGDHIHGIEYLGFKTFFNPAYKAKFGKMKLYGNHHVLEKLWDAMSPGMRSIQGRLMTLDDYFDVVRVPANGSFTFEGTKFQLIQTVHVMDGYEIVPSYGLIWVAPNGKRVFFTTDTQFAPRQIETFYDGADIIFHDCETTPFASGIHAHYKDLVTLKPETLKKTWLYHYNDGAKPDAVKDGFAGYVAKGQIFDFSVGSH